MLQMHKSTSSFLTVGEFHQEANTFQPQGIVSALEFPLCSSGSEFKQMEWQMNGRPLFSHQEFQLVQVVFEE
jgi:hypothetical protein